MTVMRTCFTSGVLHKNFVHSHNYLEVVLIRTPKSCSWLSTGKNRGKELDFDICDCSRFCTTLG
jgi:hypothetical protein